VITNELSNIAIYAYAKIIFGNVGDCISVLLYFSLPFIASLYYYALRTIHNYY